MSKKALCFGIALSIALPFALATALVAAPAVDPQLPSYRPVGGISGALTSVGSDTMLNLGTLWAEGFRKFYPSVRSQVEGKGSATAPPALIAGTAQIARMSRRMKREEIDAFERKYGYKPLALRVAIDGLAVYVHKDNPLPSLTLAQLDAIFSKTRKRGYPQDITRWGDLGLTGEWQAQPLSLYGRNSASGTYGFFKEHVLRSGDYKDSVKEQPGSSAVVQGVTEDRNGIGYSGMGYRTSGVRVLPLSEKEGDPAYDATDVNIYAGKYPLSRALYIVVNRTPGKPLTPLVREFLTYVLSKEGQQAVIKDGYLPLPAKLAEKELRKLR